MEAPMKYICFLVFVVLLSIVGLNGIDGAREIDPCASEALDQNSAVSDVCCQLVKRMVNNPSSLCAIMLSDEAKKAGVKPEVAITIPQRCNLADRPIGYKCGAYTLP